VWLGIHKGDDNEFRLLDSVEMVEQNDVGKAFQVFQPFDEFRKNLNGAPNLGRPWGLDGHSFDLFERAMNDANWPITYLHFFEPSESDWCG
jgi:hypothetical protein